MANTSYNGVFAIDLLITLLFELILSSIMTSKAKSKQQEALQLLDDLDSFTPSSEADISNSANKSSNAGRPTGNEGEAEVLAFLDEITQKSAEPTRAASVHTERPISRSGTPTLRKSTERVKLGGGSVSPSSSSSTSLSRTYSATEKAKADPAPASRGASWGWGSVWSTASAAIQQAKTVVDEQVKALPNNEHARKWGEGVIGYAKAAQLDKLGKFVPSSNKFFVKYRQRRPRLQTCWIIYSH